jgi:hypothetical protein
MIWPASAAAVDDDERELRPCSARWLLEECMKTEKKTDLSGSFIIAGVCRLVLYVWDRLFGSVAGLLLYSIFRYGWRATFPDHRSLALFVIFLGLWVVKLMTKSLQKDAWERCKFLLPGLLVLPLA